MARTYSVSKTLTFARMELLKMQVRIALRRSSDADEVSLNAINLGLTNKWISSVTIYAVDRQNLCKAQLKLEIDWNEYDLQLSRGKVKVSIDGRWNENTAIELDEAIKLFNRYAQVNSLKNKWVISYPSHLNREEINRKLGFVPAEPIKWAGKGVSNYSDIPELPELRIGLRIVD